MHIAVCDDHVADRKQLERLLGRESDKRKANEGVFYTDSYGNPEALRTNPMSYDLFFIDLVQEEPNGLTFARQLRKMGVTAPIVLCSSQIDYASLIEPDSEETSDFMHLQKPIQVASLSYVLNQATLLAGNKIPTIELRSNAGSYYVREDDILYATASGRYIHVHLTDGREISVLTNIVAFYQEVCIFPHLLMLTERSLVNVVYIKSYSMFQVVLKDGTKVKSSPLSLRDIKEALASQ